MILMTGFGYDPTHSIVKARQDGLRTVLYKPFRADRLEEAIEGALNPPAPPADCEPAATASTPASAAAAEPTPDPRPDRG